MTQISLKLMNLVVPLVVVCSPVTLKIGHRCSLKSHSVIHLPSAGHAPSNTNKQDLNEAK